MGKSAKKQFAELGVEVYEVGVNQARGWFGWRGCKYTGRDMLQMATYCETMRKGAYLVVVGYASYGYYGPTLFIYGDGSVDYAVWRVQSEIEHNEWSVSEEYFKEFPYPAKRYVHDYEVWHLVDDAELWQEWDNQSAAYIATHQPEVPQYQPVIVDEQDTDYGRDTLCSVYVPAVGQNVSFLVCEYDATGETVEYVNDDWQGWQPLRLDRICYLNWHNAEEIANGWDFSTQLLDALRQLREAGEQYEYSSGFLSGSLARAEAFVDA